MKTGAASLIMTMILLALLAAACGEGLQGGRAQSERIAFVASDVSFNDTVYGKDGNVAIYAMNPDGSATRRLTKNRADDWNPVWSPDGRRIAFVSNRDGNAEIYVMNADGSDETRLTHNDAGDWNPVWSPDGRRIAFISERDGGPPIRAYMPRINDEIYAINADGTEITRLTDNDFEDSAPAWSPDGRRIAFVSERDGNKDIYAMNAGGTEMTRLTNSDDDDYAPAWSPDGRRIAFVFDRLTTPFVTDDGDQLQFESSDIYSMNPDGSEMSRLTDGDEVDRKPVWSPDGQRIAFVSSRGHTHAWISVMNADGTSVTPLVSGHEFAWSPDGQSIVASNYPGDGDIIEGDNEIYVMSADGSEITQLTDNNHYDGAPSWGPAP